MCSLHGYYNVATPCVAIPYVANTCMAFPCVATVPLNYNFILLACPHVVPQEIYKYSCHMFAWTMFSHGVEHTHLMKFTVRHTWNSHT